MTQPVANDNAPTPEEELMQTAREIRQMLSGDAIPRYIAALREIVGTPTRTPGIITASGERLSLDQAPVPVQQHVHEMLQHGTPGNDHEAVLAMTSLMSQAASCADGFVNKKNGYGPRDTEQRLTKIGMALLDTIRQIPQYQRRHDQRSERLFNEADAKKGEKLTLDEGVALLQADPISLFSALQMKIALFQVILHQSKEKTDGKA